MSQSEVRFSPLAYADAARHELRAEPPSAELVAEQQRFTSYVKLIQDELVAYRGKTQQETDDFSDMLNRAILGFPEDRAMLLATIQEQLVHHGVGKLTDPAGQYATGAEAIFAQLIGWNVLELVLQGDQGEGVIEEIQVVGKNIYVLKGGEAKLAGYSFSTLAEVERIQQNLVLFNEDTISEQKRWAEVMLQDGSRVTMTGFGFTSEPTLTIRFYRVRHFALEDLCQPEFATLSLPHVWLLRALVHSCMNLVIIGATNTGKTHLMKSLLAELPDHERIVTMESRLELMMLRDFPQKNIIEYAVEEDGRRHDANQAFKLALRQTPQRIVLAEMRDQDANLFVRACTRGHAGSMTTVHADQLEDVPDVVADMCMLDGRPMDVGVLRRRIARHVTQIGIHLEQIGARRIVTRIGWFDMDEQGRCIVHNFVHFDRQKADWVWAEQVPAQVLHHVRQHAAEWYAKLEAYVPWAC